MTTDDIMALANKYAASNGKALLEKLYGTTRSYTEQCTAEAFQDRQALRAAIEKAAAELRRLHDENEALKAAQYECGFGAGCCYQAAKSEADEALLRQALDALAYWLEHGETPGSHDMIQRTHDALQERMK